MKGIVLKHNLLRPTRTIIALLILALVCWSLAACSSLSSQGTATPTPAPATIEGDGVFQSFGNATSVVTPTPNLAKLYLIPGDPIDHHDVLILARIENGQITQKTITLYMTIGDTVLAGTNLHYSGYDEQHFYFGDVNTSNYKSLSKGPGTRYHYKAFAFKDNYTVSELGEALGS